MAITAADLQVRLSTTGASGVKSDLASIGGVIDNTTKKSGFLKNAMSTGLGVVGAMGFVGLTSMVVDFGKSALTAGLNFEQGMSAVQAVTGATAVEMADLTKLALDIGKNTQFGATEATVAIEELAKAGVSTTNILNGAADATAMLAAAGGVDMPSAAAVMSAAMNQFGIAGEDSMRVADLLASASAVSATGVLELGESLKYVGTQASAMGYSIEDITTALAIMADQGMVGSMAGTSLNNMLLSMANPTAKARGVMDELGLSFTDLNGNMRPLPDIISDVMTATAGMGDAQRAAALEIMFGVEGGRAMNALLQSQTVEAKAAGKGWGDYYRAITKSGVASEQAAARMDNTMGALEELKGSVETFSIMATMMFLPMLRGGFEWAGRFVDGLTDMMSAFDLARANGLEPFDAAMHALQYGLSQAFGPEFAKNVVGVVRDLADVFDDARTRAGEFFDTFREDGAVAAIRDLAVDLGSMAVRIGSWAISSIVDLGSAVWDWVTNTAVPAAAGVIADIPSVAANILEWTKGVIADLREAVESWVTGEGVVLAIDLLEVAVSVLDWTEGTMADIMGDLSDWAQKAITGPVSIGDITIDVGSIDWSGVVSKVVAGIGSVFRGVFEAGRTLGSLPDMAADFANWLSGEIDSVDWGSVGEKVPGLLGGAIVTALAGTLAIPGLAITLGAGILQGLLDVNWGNVASAFGNLLSSAISAAKDFAKGLAGKLGDEFQQALGQVEWGSLASAIGSKIGDAISTTVDFAKGIGGKLFDELSQALETVNWVALAATVGIKLAEAIANTIDFAKGIGSKLYDEFTQALGGMDWGAIGVLLKDKLISAAKGIGSALWDLIIDELTGGGGENPTDVPDDLLLPKNISLPDFNIEGSLSNIASLKDRFIDLQGVAAQVGPAIQSSLSGANFDTSGISTAVNAAKESFNSLTLQAQLTTLAISLAGREVGVAFGNGVASGVTASAGTVSAATTGLVTTAGNARAGMMLAGLASGLAFGSGTATGIRSQTGAVGGAVASLVAIAGGYRGQMMAAGIGIGASLGQGIAAGIRSQIGAVAAAAASIVTTAIASAKAAGAIASPSKVMRDDVGRMLGLGAVLGVQDMIPAMASAMDGLVQVPTVPMSASGGARVGTGSGVTVNVTVPTTINLPEHVSDAEMLRIFQVYAKAQELATRTALQSEGVAA